MHRWMQCHVEVASGECHHWRAHAKMRNACGLCRAQVPRCFAADHKLPRRDNYVHTMSLLDVRSGEWAPPMNLPFPPRQHFTATLVGTDIWVVVRLPDRCHTADGSLPYRLWTADRWLPWCSQRAIPFHLRKKSSGRMLPTLPLIRLWQRGHKWRRPLQQCGVAILLITHHRNSKTCRVCVSQRECPLISEAVALRCCQCVPEGAVLHKTLTRGWCGHRRGVPMRQT